MDRGEIGEFFLVLLGLGVCSMEDWMDLRMGYCLLD